MPVPTNNSSIKQCIEKMLNEESILEATCLQYKEMDKVSLTKCNEAKFFTVILGRVVGI